MAGRGRAVSANQIDQDVHDAQSNDSINGFFNDEYELVINAAPDVFRSIYLGNGVF